MARSTSLSHQTTNLHLRGRCKGLAAKSKAGHVRAVFHVFPSDAVEDGYLPSAPRPLQCSTAVMEPGAGGKGGPGAGTWSE
jgi:hypothetical protein